MGCGASIYAANDKPSKKGWFGNRQFPLVRAPAGPAAAAVTSTGAGGLTRNTTPPTSYAGLRIDTNPKSAPAFRRPDAGMAATPVGKLAEEYKFFCPLCMMFYRNIREMPCCQQHICAYCLFDFLQTKQSPPAVATGGGEISSAPEEVQRSDPVLPRGVACPHCASVGHGQQLRLLDRKEETRSYLDSPGTAADLTRRTSSGDQPTHSPLKVGDDFQTMARKMLPFSVGAPGAETSEEGSLTVVTECSPRVEQDVTAADSGAA